MQLMELLQLFALHDVLHILQNADWATVLTYRKRPSTQKEDIDFISALHPPLSGSPTQLACGSLASKKPLASPPGVLSQALHHRPADSLKLRLCRNALAMPAFGKGHTCELRETEADPTLHALPAPATCHSHQVSHVRMPPCLVSCDRRGQQSQVRMSAS